LVKFGTLQKWNCGILKVEKHPHKPPESSSQVTRDRLFDKGDFIVAII